MVLDAISAANATKSTGYAASVVSNSSKNIVINFPTSGDKPKKKDVAKTPEEAIKEDVKNKVLYENLTVKQSILKAAGKKVEGATYSFNPEKYKEIYGRSLTLGEISKRYGLPAGELKKANNLKLNPNNKVDSKGDDLNKYRPEELLWISDLKIPGESIRKHKK